MKKFFKPKSFLAFALALSFVWMRESFGQNYDQDIDHRITVEEVGK